MTIPVRLRSRAAADIEGIVDHLLAEAGQDVAGRFVDELQRTLGRIGRHPHLGSPRLAAELDLPGLRCYRLARFPYLVFYVEHRQQIDVWRILHSRRDVPAAFSDEDESQ